MEKIELLGITIKEKRLSLNLRMEDVAKKAGITRATLWSIENGKSNCSIQTIFKILDILGISLSFENKVDKVEQRKRAAKILTERNLKINRFIIMCIEQYAKAFNEKSGDIYQKMDKAGVISELKEGYDDLHCMSTIWLNDYITAIINQENL